MNTRSEAKAPGTFRAIHAFWMIVGFFAVSIAVNTVFIIRAVSSFPGEDVRNSYVQGNDYNATLAEHADQAKLQWKAAAGIMGAGESARLVFRLTDREGRPVSARAVEARWRVVGQMRDEASLRLPEVAPGHYENIFPISGPGRVTLKLLVSNEAGGKPVFQAEKTVVLP